MIKGKDIASFNATFALYLVNGKVNYIDLDENVSSTDVSVMEFNRMMASCGKLQISQDLVLDRYGFCQYQDERYKFIRGSGEVIYFLAVD